MTPPAVPAAAGPGGERPAARPPKSARAVQYAEAVVSEWYADPDGEAYIDVSMQGVRRTLRVRSRETRALLDRLMWDAEGAPLGSQPRQDAIDVLEARARHSGIVRDLHVRVAEHAGEIWIDIGDPTWRAIRVTPAGWSVVDSHDVPVRFRRTRGMRALPVPVRGGRIEELREYIRADDDAYILIVAWLLGALRPRGPYVVLVISGEQGAAKSTCARLLRALIDPHDVPLRAPPRDERDIAIAARNAHIIALDNLSYLPVWLSDALCRIATGGGYATRELYTDADETIISATRPIILTGIEDVAGRGDLADRAYSVVLRHIPETERVPEEELYTAYAAAAPRILGALLDAVACGLSRPEVRPARLPRMADAARWVVACEPACPWEPGEYLRAYAGVRGEMLAAGIEADPVASAVLAHVDRHGGEWSGTAGDLLRELEAARGEGRPPRGWPETPRALSGRLTRAAPLLRAAGLEIARDRRPGGARTRRISIRRAERVYASDRPDRPDRPDASTGAGSGRDGMGDGRDGTHRYRPTDRPARNARGREDRDHRDGRDGLPPILSVPRVSEPDPGADNGWIVIEPLGAEEEDHERA